MQNEREGGELDPRLIQLGVASTHLYTLEQSGQGPVEAMDVFRHLLPNLDQQAAFDAKPHVPELPRQRHRCLPGVAGTLQPCEAWRPHTAGGPRAFPIFLVPSPGQRKRCGGAAESSPKCVSTPASLRSAPREENKVPVAGFFGPVLGTSHLFLLL